MLVYLVFCHKDSSLMRRSLEWMKKLGGCKGHDCVLAFEQGINANDHLALAKEIFDRVDINPVPTTSKDRIEAANQMFRSCAWNACMMKKVPWLFMEADCIPIKKGWLDALEAEYKRLGRPYMITNTGTPPHHRLTGNAVYPANVPEREQRLVKEYRPNKDGQYQAWDGIFKLMDQSNFSFTDLIYHNMGNSPGNWNDGRPLSFKTIQDLVPIMETPAVVLHRCKDGSVIDRLAGTDDRPKTALHGGDLGDAIYGMASMLALDVKKLYFSEKYGAREPMTKERAALLTPLFAHVGIEVLWHKDEWIDYDFTQFRDLYRAHKGDRCLLTTQAKWIGATVDRTKAWVTLKTPKTNTVVIARSPRYQNDQFDWKRIVGTFKDEIIFLGLPVEHEDFCKKFGQVKYVSIKDFFEAAKLISSSKLFVGNQSSLFSIAEALKHPRILEESPWAGNQDVCLHGGDVQYVLDGKMDLERFKTAKKAVLTKAEMKEVQDFVRNDVPDMEGAILQDHREGMKWGQLIGKYRVAPKKLKKILEAAHA